MSSNIWKERILNSIPGICLPASVILFFDPTLAADYFKISLLFQLAMQLNFIFGIEFQLDRLRNFNNEIGRQNFIRCVIPCAIFFVLSFIYPIKISPTTVFLATFYLAATETYSNYRMYLIIHRKFHSIIISSLLLACTPFISSFLFRSIEVLFLTQGLTLSLLALHISRNNEKLLHIPNSSWMRNFFMNFNLTAPFIWSITRGDRLIPPLFGIHPSDGYMISGAVSDSLFGTLRQSQILGRTGGYLRFFLIALLVWIFLIISIFYAKDIKLTWWYVMPAFFQFIAAIAVWRLVLLKK